MTPSFLVAWLLSSVVHSATAASFGFPHQKTVVTVPAAPQAGNSHTTFTQSLSDAFDGPKVSPINETSFEWWYFDAVDAHNSKASFVITFFTSTDKGFALLTPQPNVTTSVSISASFPNGTLFSQRLLATEAVITTEGDGASGDWKGTGASFKGASDLSRYVIHVNSPSIGVKGTLVLNSIASAHYTCGAPAAEGQDVQVFDHVAWSNAVPDAIAYADFTILGSKLKFTGVGYHDGNWGDKPFLPNVQSWYWGHARLGPYSIVWFDGIDAAGFERSSAYASLGGKIIASKCNSHPKQALSVRPTGHNSTYPPRQSTGKPDGFHIDLDLGEKYGGNLEVDVKNELVVVDEFGLYTRWVGSVVGSLTTSKKTIKGVSLHEQICVLP